MSELNMDEILDDYNLFFLCLLIDSVQQQLLNEKEEEWNIKEAKRQALIEAEEAHDIKLLHCSLVHKAQPIHQYSSI